MQRLGENPSREPDFTEHDDHGPIDGVVFEYYVILYRVDHAAKRVLVADVTFADQI